MARVPTGLAGVGYRLDRMPVPFAVAMGVGLGVVAGTAAGQLGLWPGSLVFVTALGAGVGLAWRSRSVLVVEPSERSRVDESPTAETPTDGMPVVETPAAADEVDKQAPEPDDVIDPMPVVTIPEGVFLMGSSADDDSAHEDEKPAHRVHVSSFVCMTVPVTRAFWADVMGTSHEWYPSGPDDDRSANQVSWYDAVRFCNALSAREGLKPCYEIDGERIEWVSSEGYRLPTEAEWEYACRAGSESRWSFGDDERLLGEYAWFGANTSEPMPVGGKLPNGWGLFDMHGNVWEWCWDRYGDYDVANPDKPVSNPRGAGHGLLRVLRGGAFGYSAWLLRCANRSGDRPAYQDWSTGFRCVRGSGRQP